jgi:hypothetical protein
MHFLMEESFAAPLRGFPSLLRALSVQHFFMWLVLAAPDNGLPSALTALQTGSCAIAAPSAKDEITAATKIRFMAAPPLSSDIIIPRRKNTVVATGFTAKGRRRQDGKPVRHRE